MTLEEIHNYYSTKKYCRVDLDKLTWSNNKGDTPIPYSHPVIKYLLFIDDIKDRNRYQNILDEIDKHNSFEIAKRIHSGIFFCLDDAVKDLKNRIRKLEIKIENFHKSYYI